MSIVNQHKGGAWVDFLIDSGSDAHMVPIGMFDAPVIPRASGSKVKFELANGKTIDSAGTQILECTTKNGHVFRIQCHAAPVEGPIIPSGLLLNHGVSTVLQNNEAYIKTSNNEKMHLIRIRQTFVLDVKASSFVGQ